MGRGVLKAIRTSGFVVAASVIAASGIILINDASAYTELLRAGSAHAKLDVANAAAGFIGLAYGGWRMNYWYRKLKESRRD